MFICICKSDNAKMLESQPRGASIVPCPKGPVSGRGSAAGH